MNVYIDWYELVSIAQVSLFCFGIIVALLCVIIFAKGVN